MTPTLFPSVFTIEIGGTPTVTFEAKSLREANEICNAPWLREDFTSTHSNGALLWDGKAPLRARMGYADEIATFGDAAKDAQPSDGMLLVYLVELDDDDTAENSEPSSLPNGAEKRWKRFMRAAGPLGIPRKKKPGTECRASDRIRSVGRPEPPYT